MNEQIKAGADIHAGDGGYSIGTKEKYDEFVKGRNQSLGKMRIKELVRESNLDVYGLGKERYKWEYTVEKFAELIVKECIRVPYDMWDKAELNADIAVKIEHRIKEHFGVEE